jgi:hypothetical protein
MSQFIYIYLFITMLELTIWNGVLWRGSVKNDFIDTYSTCTLLTYLYVWIQIGFQYQSLCGGWSCYRFSLSTSHRSAFSSSLLTKYAGIYSKKVTHLYRYSHSSFGARISRTRYIRICCAREMRASMQDMRAVSRVRTKECYFWSHLKSCPTLWLIRVRG